ncbi:MAG: hypothetical protein JWR69_56 [Pedosphaera sp.]|nr:hypothetical protein [Pedosphaera sp.]
MAERNWKAADICRQIPGMHNSFMSRILRSQQEFISKKDLISIADCFAKDAQGHATTLDSAKIVMAHCMDERVGPGAEFVKITLEQHGKHIDVDSALPPDGEKACRFIRATCHGDSKFEAMIIAMARAFGMKH